MPEADHPLRFDIPNFQPQTTDDFHRMERGGLGHFQLGYRLDDLRQSVEGDAGIQVMNVMIADCI
jgi:hypothetical protein